MYCLSPADQSSFSQCTALYLLANQSSFSQSSFSQSSFSQSSFILLCIAGQSSFSHSSFSQCTALYPLANHSANHHSTNALPCFCWAIIIQPMHCLVSAGQSSFSQCTALYPLANINQLIKIYIAPRSLPRGIIKVKSQCSCILF